MPVVDVGGDCLLLLLLMTLAFERAPVGVVATAPVLLLFGEVGVVVLLPVAEESKFERSCKLIWLFVCLFVFVLKIIFFIYIKNILDKD